MRKQDIEIVINEKGEVTFTVKGVKGGSCMDETKFLEQALGGDAAVVDQQKTGEFYEQSEGYVSTWAGSGSGEGESE
jgi:Protein of unknown function (DUF2997)